VPRALVTALLTALAVAAFAAPAAAAPSAGCGQDVPSGRTTLTLASGGMQRVVVVHVPARFTGRRALPLVLNLHGSASTAEEQLDRSELVRTADRQGFIVASPQGILPAAPAGFRWNVPGVTTTDPAAPDDERFLSDVIDHLQQDLCVDTQRVYGTGYSGGGRMISQYACDHADRLAAIAPVAGLRAGHPITTPDGPQPDPATCTPSRPVPVVAFAGTADPVNPYAGGGAPYWLYGIEAAQQRWAELNGCDVGPRTTRVEPHVFRVAFYRCDERAWVVLYRVVGGGHTWPGSRAFAAQPELGPTTFEIDAAGWMWSFLRRYRLP
jgi:polyhydroxybutyrate depolymerase